MGGSDTINGRGGSDIIDAGAGVDRILGSSGSDTLIGASSSDTLLGGIGADKLIGGDGRDVVSYADHTSNVWAIIDGERNDGAAGEGDLNARDVENLAGGEAHGRGRTVEEPRSRARSAAAASSVRLTRVEFRG